MSLRTDIMGMPLFSAAIPTYGALPQSMISFSAYSGLYLLASGPGIGRGF